MGYRGIELTRRGAGFDVAEMMSVYPDPERREWIRKRLAEWEQRRLARRRATLTADAMQEPSGTAGPSRALEALETP